LGNLYTAVVQLLHFANYYKKLGYKCDFIFASKNTYGRNGWGLDKINIEEIFDMGTFDVFDTITNVEFSIIDKEYNGYTFYGGSNPSGVWWDVFFSEKINNFYQLSYGNHDGNIFSNRDFIPDKIPQFNKKIIDIVKKFEEENTDVSESIQLRLFGFGDTENYNPNLIELYDSIYKKLNNKEKKYFLTSSCVSCLGKLLELPNVKIIDSRLKNEYYGDTENFYNRESRINFLYNNIAEMVLISKTNIVYHKTVLSWTSTFLYYAFVNNPNIKILKIDDL
jgi:hypothetical protein